VPGRQSPPLSARVLAGPHPTASSIAAASGGWWRRGGHGSRRRRRQTPWWLLRLVTVPRCWHHNSSTLSLPGGVRSCPSAPCRRVSCTGTQFPSAGRSSFEGRSVTWMTYPSPMPERRRALEICPQCDGYFSSIPSVAPGHGSRRCEVLLVERRCRGWPTIRQWTGPP